METKIYWLELGELAKNEMVDLTPRVNELIQRSGLKRGIAAVASPSSTTAITTVEYEPGLIHDIPAYLEKLFGGDAGDETRTAAIKSAFMPPMLSLPFEDTRLILGRWQQLTVLELSGSSNVRVAVALLGE